MAKHKHLTLDERYTIQHMLDSAKSFRQIALYTGKDNTTISKEVRRHYVVKQTGGYDCAFNNCKHRKKCQRERRCNSPKCFRRRCNRCNLCNKYCKDYEREDCSKLSKAPYVCNGCSRRHRCSLEKRFYSAAHANEEYRLSLKATRTGVCISEKEALKLDKLISPLILNGQSIHHIYVNNRDEIMYSERSIYNYIDKGIFTAKNVDLTRKVRFKARKSKHDSIKVDKKCRIGRTMKDFQAFMVDNPDMPIVEIDSVIGEPGGKLLLTIHFVKTEFMLAFLRERNTAASVIKIFNDLYERLGSEMYMNLFPVILADNGSEFSDPTAIEVDQDGVIRSRVFYCDPSSPYQKGSIENNHEFIRRVIPKGKSMDDLTQENINLMMDHINSYKRKNLADKSPYEVFQLLYGRAALDILGAHLIPPNEIILRPKLLK